MDVERTRYHRGGFGGAAAVGVAAGRGGPERDDLRPEVGGAGGGALTRQGFERRTPGGGGDHGVAGNTLDPYSRVGGSSPPGHPSRLPYTPHYSGRQRELPSN